MYHAQELGKGGEDLACKYLEENNYQILERNFSCSQGEIDIIAKDKLKQEIVFFEVKTRSNTKYGSPANSVNTKKQKHIKKAIKYYAYKNNLKNIPIRIDVIEIYTKREDYNINQIQQII